MQSDTSLFVCFDIWKCDCCDCWKRSKDLWRWNRTQDFSEDTPWNLMIVIVMIKVHLSFRCVLIVTYGKAANADADVDVDADVDADDKDPLTP